MATNIFFRKSVATNIFFRKKIVINLPSETRRTVGGELPGEGERVVLQPALPHHLHVPHEVQQVPLRQVLQTLRLMKVECATPAATSVR